MSAIIVAISGKKRAGKDELAKLMSQKCNGKTVRIAFADELKIEVAHICGVTVSFIENNKEFFRPILQWWGSFKRKTINQNYWVDKALAKINSEIDAGINVIFIPDLRFRNEAKTLKEVGSVLIRIARPEQICDEHESETELDDYKGFDEIILNRGTLSDLEHEAVGLLQKLNILTK